MNNQHQEYERDYPWTTLLDVLRWRACHHPDQLALSFLPDGHDGKEDTRHVSYGELDRQARIIAAQLQTLDSTSKPVLLLYPPGLDYIAGLLGCIYAGAIAVPIYPPRSNRSLDRLYRVVRDSGAAAVLTIQSLYVEIERNLTLIAELKALPWVSTDQLSLDLEKIWSAPTLAAESLAILQYTSGSTSTPKGVMVTHGNLLHNLALIQHHFEHSAESRGVIWLPPYHDMGLVGGILQPLYAGFPCTLMSPTSFLRSPFRWLEAISTHRGTTSGGPNFAYELCLRSITDEQKALLDLSSWSVAFTGAEPIQPATLHRFAQAFAVCGFRPTAFYASYGLAEATLFVSGGTVSAAPIMCMVETEALARNRAVSCSPEHPQARVLVSCGHPVQSLVVVNPETRHQCEPNEVGEIWVASPSVAAGYWQNDAETQEMFTAFLADTGSGPFLRTGDLGFLQDGELYITGRLKNVIILRGRNYYPHDIEATVQKCHPGLRPGCGAAFTVELGGEQRLVVVQEVEREYRSKLKVEEVAAQIRRAVSEEFEILIDTVVFLRPGSIPKTSSGKIQHYLCREAFLAGELASLGTSVVSTLPASGELAENDAAGQLTRGQLLASERGQQQALLEIYLRTQLVNILHIDPGQIAKDLPLSSFGMDSITMVALQHRIETDLAVVLPLTDFFMDGGLGWIAEQILAQIAQPPVASHSSESGAAQPLAYPLSYGQRALWFLHGLAEECDPYTIATAIRIEGALDTARCRRAFQLLVDRHPALRTTIQSSDAGAVQHVQPLMELAFQHIDASTWDNTTLQQYLVHEAQQPFNLEAGPLFRVHLLQRSPREYVLLLAIHHIISDFWSLAVLLSEFGQLYAQQEQEPAAALLPLSLHYSDFVRRQEAYLVSPEGGRAWSYWQQALASAALPPLNLSIARPRPPVQTYRGRKQMLRFQAELTTQLKDFCRRYNLTPFMALLAAFQVLLYRYSGQEQFLIGSPTSNRSTADLAGLVGYVVNPIVLKADLRGNPSFHCLVQRVRQQVLEALEHQEYPFALLAERLPVHRDPSRSPLFQVMFLFQQAPSIGAEQQEALSAFALGQPDARMQLGDLLFESLDLDLQVSQFDLSVMIAEISGSYSVVAQYNRDLFDDEALQRMLLHLQVIVERVLVDPEKAIANIPILTESELAHIAALNATKTAYPATACIHELFESQVAQTPDAVAVVFEGQELTYRQLNEHANQLAHYLCTRGVGPEVLVGICLERSLEMVIGLLAILKAGGAYVPIDPNYPTNRTALILADANIRFLLTTAALGAQLPASTVEVIYLDAERNVLLRQPTTNLQSHVTAANAAYVIYTSGSTGTPKGVVIHHCSVVNFFVGMDERVACSSEDTFLAVTSISFDISILELFWTLTRGAKVVILSEEAITASSAHLDDATAQRPLRFSLFYFASADSAEDQDKYRLLIEGAKFADRHGFEAIWTPERHFHQFGGLYPNPSVIGAALAMTTERIRIRGGSVVLPLHHPIRVAEEWSVVDNLSHGRVDLAFASGWHTDDFVFFPKHYPQRKEIMDQGIATVQRLWRGEAVQVEGGAGNEISVSLFPKPIQAELPIWITAAGSQETFIKAGELGANVLTHLLGQDLEELTQKIALYRQTLAAHGHDPAKGVVTLMLHTFLGEDQESIREQVRGPFTNYLRSSIGLIENLIRSLKLPLDLQSMSPQDLDALLDFAFSRYYDTSALFGSPKSVLKMIERVRAMGVDEVACLIDFGINTEQTLAHLRYIHELKELSNHAQIDYSLPAQAARHKATMLQCTPSMLRLMSGNPLALQALGKLRTLLLGGEQLSAPLVQLVREHSSCRIINMYGPTETTIWSATYEINEVHPTIPIGCPIANTQLYILNSSLQPVPIGSIGELYIGGDGLARGYFNQPALTAERFVPDPFSATPHARMYRTGDFARLLPEGNVEFLGRVDQQVKLRGYRIELEEIEVVLSTHPAVREAIVVAREIAADDVRLIAYVIGDAALATMTDELRRYLREKLPEYMVPAWFAVLNAFPLTANQKVDRKALPLPQQHLIGSQEKSIAPSTRLEQTIAQVWCDALKIPTVGIHDNFFDLGGHSLLIALVHRQLQERLQRSFPLVKLLEHPTISALANYLEHDQAQQPSLQASFDRARMQRDALMRQRRRRQVEMD